MPGCQNHRCLMITSIKVFLKLGSYLHEVTAMITPCIRPRQNPSVEVENWVKAATLVEELWTTVKYWEKESCLFFF